MLIVIAILGIVLSIAIPTYEAINASANVRGAAQLLTMDLQLAKMRAISQNKNTRLLFIDGTNYKFQYYDNAAAIWKDFSGEPVRSFCSSSNLYYHQGVTITAPVGQEVVFQPWGSSTTATIEVKNSKKKGTVNVTSSGKISTQVTDL